MWKSKYGDVPKRNWIVEEENRNRQFLPSVASVTYSISFLIRKCMEGRRLPRSQGPDKGARYPKLLPLNCVHMCSSTLHVQGNCALTFYFKFTSSIPSWSSCSMTKKFQEGSEYGGITWTWGSIRRIHPGLDSVSSKELGSREKLERNDEEIRGGCNPLVPKT